MSATAAFSDLRRLIAVGAVTAVEFLENGLVMFGASQIITGLPLSHEGFAFAYTLYGVAVIFMLYKHQWLVERMGYRRFVRASLVAFALGAGLCATAGSELQFAVGRVLQGLGGATFFTAGRMSINDLPESLRLKGFAIFIGSLLGASAIAPLLAAGLIAVGGWQGLFWFGLFECVLVGWLATPCLSAAISAPEARSEEHWGWLVWVALGVFGLQYTIQALPTVDRENRPEMLGLALASIIVLTMFAWRQWRRERPLINYRGLFQWRYLLGLGLYFGGYLLAGLSGFALPLHLQAGLGWSLTMTALLLSFGLSGSVLVALAHFSASRRWPWHRTYMLAGLGLYALANFCLAQGVDRGWPLWACVWLCGASIPLYIGPVAMGTFSELQARVFSHAYQVKNIVRQLGLSASIAIATLLLAQPGPSFLAASQQVFLLMALTTLPLALAVIVQRVFR